MIENNLFTQESAPESENKKSNLEKMTKTQLLKVIEELRIKNKVEDYSTACNPESVVVPAINKIKSNSDYDPYKEHFILFCLNTKNIIIKSEIISIGHLTGSLVHPREVFKSAILGSANSIIVAHNHPSGEPEPSKADNEITRSLKECGEILGIPLVDHIIFTMTEQYYSFSKEGRL